MKRLFTFPCIDFSVPYHFLSGELKCQIIPQENVRKHNNLVWFCYFIMPCYYQLMIISQVE